MKDLWPDSITPDVEGNAANASAAAASAKYEARVSDFEYNFFIVGPILGDYHYYLFKIRHGIEFYPLELEVREDLVSAFPDGTLMENNTTAIIREPEQFEKTLQAIFAAEKTLRIIKAIHIQSQASPGRTRCKARSSCRR